MARRVLAWLGAAWLGMAGKAGLGLARHGKARQGGECVMAPDRYEQGRRDHADRRYDQRLADSDPNYRQGYIDAEIAANDAELAALRARGVGVGRAGSTERHWFPCLVWLVVPALLLIAAATALTSWGT